MAPPEGPRYLPLMALTYGTCTDRFAAVREALAASLDDKDVGASVAVYVDGEPVVDLWGGYTDADRTTPWERDTLTHVWSTTKTMTALCVLMLADRGELDLDAPVATYWPEFAAAGKEDVRVRHVLAHTAYLPRFEAPTTLEDLYDWPTVTSRLAAQAPAWEPGTEAGLPRGHPGVSARGDRPPGHRPQPGHLPRRGGHGPAGRRLPHRAPRRARPPGGADHRAALVLAPGRPAAQPGHTGRHRQHDRLAPRRDPGRERSRQRPLGRRRAVAAGLRRGGARCAPAVGEGVRTGPGGAVRRHGQCPGRTDALRHGLRPQRRPTAQPRTCFWASWGGSIVLVDLDARMAVAYVMNQMIDEGLGDDRAFMILAAVYEGLSG